MFAVSRKLPPASANASRMSLDVLSSTPQDIFSPNVIVPSASSETRTPERPSNLYRTLASTSGRAFIEDSRRAIRVTTILEGLHADLAWANAHAVDADLPGSGPPGVDQRGVSNPRVHTVGRVTPHRGARGRVRRTTPRAGTERCRADAVRPSPAPARRRRTGS